MTFKANKNMRYTICNTQNNRGMKKVKFLLSLLSLIHWTGKKFVQKTMLRLAIETKFLLNEAVVECFEIWIILRKWLNWE